MARSHGRRTARIVFAWLATPNYAAPHPLSLPSELHDDSACNSAYPFCSSLLAHVAVGFCRAAKPTRSAREGLSIRGFTNVLSPGIDQLAAELRNRNVSTTVANHVFYPALANEALQDCKSGRVSSIVLVGHSVGASAAIAMAETLQKSGVQVALIVTFDPVLKTSVPTNVHQLKNFYVSNGVGRPVELVEHFRGRMKNVDLKSNSELGHISVTTFPPIQRQILSDILAARVPCNRV